MKWHIAIAAALCLWLGLPFREYRTTQLLPIKTLQVLRQEEKIYLISEAAEGEGQTLVKCVADARKKAAGELLFETAQHLVVPDAALARELLRSELLRGSVQVYFSDVRLEPQGLSEYCAAHPSELRLKEFEKD